MSIGRVPGVTGIQPSIVDAKGDLIVATAADSVDRLAVGSANQVLTVDSSTATGLKWATPAGEPFVGCSVFNSTTQSIPNNTYTAVTFDSENFDSDGFHSTTTNTSRLTIPSGKGGKYLFKGQFAADSSNTGARYINLYKNGSLLFFQELSLSTRGDLFLHLVTIQNAVAGDYFELFYYQTTGGNQTINKAQGYTEFSCALLGA